MLKSISDRVWDLHNQTGTKTEPKPLRNWGCSSAGRAPALHAGGQEFDPPHLHQEGKGEKNDRTVTADGRIAQVVRAHA